MPGIASSAPAVLIGHLASATTTLRVGSGGVMLPNHAPLVVAEQFGMLEALHPGRIDLGIGRAPGTDQITALALRRSRRRLSRRMISPSNSPICSGSSGVRGPTAIRSARSGRCPALGNQPDIWLLGSSGYSAQVAGLFGLPFAFAHHFSSANTEPALKLYGDCFRPSARWTNRTPSSGWRSSAPTRQPEPGICTARRNSRWFACAPDGRASSRARRRRRRIPTRRATSSSSTASEARRWWAIPTG